MARKHPKRAMASALVGGMTVAATVAVRCGERDLCADAGPHLFQAVNALTDALRDQSTGERWANSEPLPASMDASVLAVADARTRPTCCVCWKRPVAARRPPALFGGLSRS